MNEADAQPGCEYCGLPLGGGWFAARDSRGRDLAEPSYCCSGCRLAAEITRDGSTAPSKLLARLGFAIFLTMNVVCFTMALWSGDVYADGDPARTPLGSVLAGVFRYLSLLFSWPVAYLLAGPLVHNAWQQLRRGAAATDLLLVLGVFAAFAYSTISVFRGTGHVYFEVGCVVLVFVTLGRWLEVTGRQQANAALDALASLLPTEVLKIVANREVRTPLDEIERGDRLRLLAGDRVPTDCRIVTGAAAIDEQLITGESQPAVKEAGDLLYGGTLNLDGALVVETTAAAKEGTLRRLVDSVAAARRTKGRYQRLAERLAQWFLPAALLAALGTFAIHTYAFGVERGLLGAMAVVLIACPCALGLATPLAVWTALGTAARSQILFRHGEALERLAATQVLFFDKTGTLSTGDAEVVEFAAAVGEDPSEIHRRAASLAALSNHPLSMALCNYLELEQSDDRIAFDVQSSAGRGLVGHMAGGGSCWLGSSRWMRESGLQPPADLQSVIEAFERKSLAIVCIGWHGKVRGAYACGESLRPEACTAMQSLKGLNLDLEILSGDHAARAAKVGGTLGVPVRGELLPADKVVILRGAQQQGRSTAMVGDGINDAPALAAADVGVALGCGADVSREAADVCLLGSNLNHLVDAILLARRTVRIIRQNLFWTFAYNVVGIGLAVSGALNPMWAAAAMTASSVIVITNSLRLAGAADAPRRAEPIRLARPLGENSAFPAPVSELGDAHA